jgi:hypothetical protein
MDEAMTWGAPAEAVHSRWKTRSPSDIFVRNSRTISVGCSRSWLQWAISLIRRETAPNVWRTLQKPTLTFTSCHPFSFSVQNGGFTAKFMTNFTAVSYHSPENRLIITQEFIYPTGLASVSAVISPSSSENPVRLASRAEHNSAIERFKIWSEVSSTVTQFSGRVRISRFKFEWLLTLGHLEFWGPTGLAFVGGPKQTKWRIGIISVNHNQSVFRIFANHENRITKRGWNGSIELDLENGTNAVGLNFKWPIDQKLTLKWGWAIVNGLQTTRGLFIGGVWRPAPGVTVKASTGFNGAAAYGVEFRIS